MSDAVFIVIERFDGKKRYSQEYTLARADVHNKTVLSTLIFIKEHLDPTLNFTAACRMAICGACGVRLNGQPIIACDTSMEDQLALYATNRVTIAPLANFKVISDLVVDWEPALENLRKVHPSLMARKEFSKEKGCRQSAGDMLLRPRPAPANAAGTCPLWQNSCADRHSPAPCARRHGHRAQGRQQRYPHRQGRD